MLREVQYKLRFAVKPPSGPPEDAMTHALLMALDFASVMRCRSSRPIKIFVDRDALAGLESPINLHAHHHEELVARTEKELAEFQDIMNGPLSERTTRHRSWYHRILHKKLMRKGVGSNMDCYLQAVRRDPQRDDECSQVVREPTILPSIFSTTRLTSS